MQDYDFILRHILGKTNTKADILSRKDQVDTKEDNKDVQLLKDEMWSRKIVGKIWIFDNRKVVEEMDIIKRIKKNRTREKKIVQALQKEDGLAWEEDEVAYMEGRIYIPNNKDIKEEILKEHHDPADVRYPGQHRMQELIKRTYWWPGLKEDVKKYVQGCIKCQQNKVQHQKRAGELYPLEIPEGPWQDISINMIGPLPRSNEMDAILVIVDRFTKMIRLKATTTNISLEGVAKIYNTENQKETVYSILPSDRRTDRKNQPGNRNVLMTLRQLSAG